MVIAIVVYGHGEINSQPQIPGYNFKLKDFSPWDMEPDI